MTDWSVIASLVDTAEEAVPKQTLQNIPAEKRERVLREAAALFAERGYESADMAALAERCGISKGSIYTYFSSKDALYLYVCRDGLDRSRRAVWGGVDPSSDVFTVVAHTFRAGVAFEKMAAELSDEVERPTAERWKELLKAGIAAGRVRADLDVPLAAWQINNAYVMLLAALVSEHFKIRLRAYLELPGRLSEKQTSVLCDRAIELIGESLRNPSPPGK